MEELDTVLYNSFQNLKEQNGPQKTNEALGILTKLLRNIIDHPQEPKYKGIKKSNKVIATKLLGANGILPILHRIGYSEQDSDNLVMAEVSQDNLETAFAITEAFVSELKDELKTEEEKLHEKKQKEMREKARARELERKKLLEQAALDRKENSNRAVQASHARDLGSSKQVTYKDIGVDLNSQKKG